MRNPSPWLESLNLACEGTALATSVQSDKKARSTQFELFTMAYLTMADFPASPIEPDVQASVGGEEVAFAAKRLRSVSKFPRNLRAACKQLARHTVPGFAVIDLSFVESLQKPIYVPRIGQQQAVAAILLDGFAEEHERDIFDAAHHSHVRGVLLHASVICRSVQPAARFVSRRWLLGAAKDSDVARKLVTAFQTLGQSPHNNAR
jgi:hypothetical protein